MNECLRFLRNLAGVAGMLVCGAAIADPPTITSVSNTEPTLSARVVITGTGFGALQGTSLVTIGGLTSPVTRWTDTSVTAYVLGAAPTGAGTIHIQTTDGVSNDVSITIDPVDRAAGHVLWRFQADAATIPHRAAVGADGTVYVNDAHGFLYALSADGLLKWIYDAAGYTEGEGGQGPAAVSSDGTIFVAGKPLGPAVEIHAVNPDGSRRWVYSDSITDGVIAGPSIGPDDNLYFVTDFGGHIVTSLTPAGDVRFTNPGSPPIDEVGQVGEEIAFGPSSSGGPVDQFYCAFDMFGNGGGDRLFGFSLAGTQRFASLTGVQGATNGQRQGQPAVGPDGTVYMCADIAGTGWRLQSFDAAGSPGWTWFDSSTLVLSEPNTGSDGAVYVTRNLNEVHAVNPSPSQRWVYADPGLLGGPVVSPDNSIVLAGGRVGLNMPGVIRAIDNTGALSWSLNLPTTSDMQMVPVSRAKFTPDSSHAYISTTLLHQPVGQEVSYLYALRMNLPCPADIDDGSGTGTPDGGVTVEDLLFFIVLIGAGDERADLDDGSGTGTPDGGVTIEDLLFFIAHLIAGC